MRRQVPRTEPTIPRRRWAVAVALATVTTGIAHADEPSATSGDAALDGGSDAGEMIEVEGTAVAPAGTVSVDARVARQTAGAMGEPFRVLALLPGVTTSVAASGSPIIRGTLPGESRFSFDGIELPLLYHLLLGNQVIHPAFLGDISLRAGGYGAEHGHILGGLVEMTPAAIDQPRTELRANLIEVGAFHAQRLSKTTALAAAVRVGTLAAAAKLYDADAALYYVDQQLRLVHRLGNGDQLTLTSLGAYDYAREPPAPDVRTTKLGFHRLDLRWSRGAQLRAGVETDLDELRGVEKFAPVMVPAGAEPVPTPPTAHSGGYAYGARAYADAGHRLAGWLTARGGVEAHARKLVNRAPVFELSNAVDPLLGVAREFDSEGAWAALDLRAGPIVFTPGVRVDRYHAVMTSDVVARHASLDPRLAVTAELPNGGRAEVSGGFYSAPPQVSIIESSVAIGPLPVTEGTALTSGLSHGYQGQASIRTPLGASLDGALATYYRDTRYAVDFAMVNRSFSNHKLCDQDFAPEASVYRNLGVRALGLEAMVRGKLGPAEGWLSYSLGKVDRDLGFTRLPHDYDQRHTLAATAQWRRGRWTFGASGHLHTGRPLLYPVVSTCAGGSVDTRTDPTHLRRQPTTPRLDLRAERTFPLAAGSLRLYFELQNATFTEEVLDYTANYATARVDANTLLLPIPIIGLEVDL